MSILYVIFSCLHQNSLLYLFVEIQIDTEDPDMRTFDEMKAAVEAHNATQDKEFLAKIVEEMQADRDWIRIAENVLTDGSSTFDVLLPDGTEIWAEDREKAYKIANALDGLCGQFDGWADTVKRRH